jgi:hypothetical protein
MTIYQFESLPLPDKSKILWEHGELVGDKTEHDYIISIYKLFTFHVEVYCDKDFTTIENILAR